MSITRRVGTKQSWLALCLMIASLVGIFLIGVTVRSQTSSAESAPKVKIARSRRRATQPIQKNQPDDQKNITGQYKGYVEVPGGIKSATLSIRKGVSDAYDFELKIEGQDRPEVGQLTVAPDYEKGSYPANMVFVMDGQPFSVSVRLFIKKNAITLKSVEDDKKVLFETCLPPPGCKEQPKCEPCEPF